MSDEAATDPHRRERELACRLLDERGDDEEVVAAATVLLGVLDELDDLRAETQDRTEQTGLLADQLESERTRYRELFEAAPDPYLVSDLDGVVREHNRAAEAVLDVKPAKPLVLNVAPDDRIAFHRFLSSRDGPVGRTTLEFLSRDGPIPMDIQCNAVGGDQLLWLLRDVTEIEDARQGLKDVAEADRLLAEQLQELDEIRSAFLLATAHDLRTPVAAIAGLADLLTSQPRLDTEERRSAVRQIGSTAHRLVELLADLLDLERLQRLEVIVQRSESDLAGILAAVVDRVDLGDRELHLDCTAGEAMVDPVLVERIAENLLRNAASHVPREATVWVRCSREPDGVLLVVEDDGPGVDPAFVPKAFDPFQRDRRAAGTGGLGVGLALVRRFAELHGGYARLHERPGGGASFHILLTER